MAATEVSSPASAAPELPDDIQPSDLDPEVRAELKLLPRQVADSVARHLVAAGELVEDDPVEALAHAVAARRLAPRVGVVREAVGLAAYRAGEWQTAVAELRTYHRMAGQQPHLAVLADCERALGRPERAIDLYRGAARAELGAEAAVELLIVAAGARLDLGQHEASLQMLQVPELTADPPALGAARLRYAYADTLLAAGRQADARDWFARAAAADEEGETGAAERLLELDGVVLDEAEPEPDEPAPVDVELTPVEPESASVASVSVDADSAVPELVDAASSAASGSGRLVDQYDLVILDLDGVLILGEEPIPSAVAAVAQLREVGIGVVFATNNASREPAEVAALLTRIGIPAAVDEVLTSAMVAAEALADRLPAGSAVLVVGAESLVTELDRVGLRPVTTADEQPAAVLQGYGPQVGWPVLAEAAVAIRGGAQWVATNTDATLPSPRGPLPGNGSLVAVLRTALEREPDLVTGKPQPAFFAAAARRAGARLPLVVGDRLDTDIEGAVLVGMDSLLVLTGVTSAEQARMAPPSQRATYRGADLGALLRPANDGG